MTTNGGRDRPDRAVVRTRARITWAPESIGPLSWARRGGRESAPGSRRLARMSDDELTTLVKRTEAAWEEFKRAVEASRKDPDNAEAKARRHAALADVERLLRLLREPEGG